MRRLQRLAQDDEVEGVVGIGGEIVVGVALDDRKAARHGLVDALLRQLDAAAVGLLLLLEALQQRAVAAADVEHARARRHEAGDDLQVDALGMSAAMTR